MISTQLRQLLTDIEEVAKTFAFESQNRFSHLTHAEGESWLELRVHLTGKAPDGGRENHNLTAFGSRLYGYYEPLGYICTDVNIVFSGTEICMYKIELEKEGADESA